MKINHVKLKLRVDDDRDKEVRYGRRTRVTRKLKSYDVIGPDGAHLGIVAEEMTTFEQRTPGRMYVNRRWESPRWYGWIGDDRWGRRGSYKETRKQAVECVVAEHNRPKEDQ